MIRILQEERRLHKPSLDGQADFDTVVAKGASLLQLPEEKCCFVHMNRLRLLIKTLNITMGDIHGPLANTWPQLTPRILHIIYKLGILCEEQFFQGMKVNQVSCVLTHNTCIRTCRAMMIHSCIIMVKKIK